METRIVKKETSEFAHNVSDFFNSFGNDYEGIAKILADSHRAIIDYMVKMVVTFLVKLADDYKHNRYDGRDESAVKKAYVMIEALKESGMIVDWTIDDMIERMNNTFDCR